MTASSWTGSPLHHAPMLDHPRGGYPVLTPEQAADIVAIERLVKYYGYIHDQGTARQVADLFHPDATIEALFEGKTYRGRDEIFAWYDGWFTRGANTSAFDRHRISCEAVDLQGDRAEVSSFLDADELKFEDQCIWQYIGRYDDTLIKEGGRWFFLVKRIQVFYLYQSNQHYVAPNGTAILTAMGHSPS